MKTKIKKNKHSSLFLVGGSRAIVLPAKWLDIIGCSESDDVELRLVRNNIVVGKRVTK